MERGRRNALRRLRQRPEAYGKHKAKNALEGGRGDDLKRHGGSRQKDRDRKSAFLNFIPRTNTAVSDSWRTLLDVGCGPTVANVFPATRKIQTIVLSDLVPRNREEVEKWIQKSSDAIDWSFMSEPLAILEGYRNVKNGAREIEERTRAAVEKVISCDVLDPNVLPQGHKQVFDVVFSSLCLEAATRDETTYQAVTRNVSSLIREGGHLILCGIAGATEYTVGDATFPDLGLTKAMVENALRGSGLKVKRWSSLDKHISSDSAEYWDFVFVVLAEKL